MYVKILEGAVEAYPYGVIELMRDNSNTSFPDTVNDELLAGYSVYPVTPTEIPQPFDSLTQNVAEVYPVLIDGAWVQSWAISEASDEEKAQRISDLAQNIRADRDYRLSQTDWMALKDNNMSPEWAAYRQALRDITSQPDFPLSVIWPTKP